MYNRVSGLLPSWDKSRSSGSKKFFGWADKITPPLSIANGAGTAQPSSAAPARIGRETYWPTSIDRECEKAARILKSFCTDGYLTYDESVPSSPTSSTISTELKSAAMMKIPARIIQDAMGLAIFSCLRSGLWKSGSGGSGILIARKADGTWSPPSGILIHTAELAFKLNVDIYDCILVINNVAALEMFTRPELTLGFGMELTVGPTVSTMSPDASMNWKEYNNAMVLTYVKARGQHQSVHMDGSQVAERANENATFYGSNIHILDILAGNVSKSIPEITPLYEMIKAAEGRSDFDLATMDRLSQMPAPGDAMIAPSPTPITTPVSPFGIPDVDDPDPYGVRALEMAGLEIKEAGSQARPPSTQFEYNPSPTSPTFSKFNRQSVDTFLSRSNRGSYMSSRTQATLMTDAGTQTCQPDTPATTFSPSHSDDGIERASVDSGAMIQEPAEVDYTKVDLTPLARLSQRASVGVRRRSRDEEISNIPEETTQAGQKEQTVPEEAQKDSLDATPIAARQSGDEMGDADDEDDESEGEEAVICEVATAAQAPQPLAISSQVIKAKGALVTIPKRVPPPVPMRSPARLSRTSNGDFTDLHRLSSPLRQSFQQSDLAGSPRSSGDYTKPEKHQVDYDSASMEKVLGGSEADLDKTLNVDDFGVNDRHASSIYTSTDRWSITSSAQTPDTPVATEGGSSADDDGSEPDTPKLQVGAFPTAAIGNKTFGTKQTEIASHEASTAREAVV